MSEIQNMKKQFYDILRDMDPKRIPKATDTAPMESDLDTPAAFVICTSEAHSLAIAEDKPEHAKKFLEMHNEAIDKTELGDINKEISKFYFRAYQLQSAQVHIKAVSTLTEETVPEKSLSDIESHLDKFSSRVEKAVTSAYKMITSTLIRFKEKITILKDSTTSFITKLKDKFIEAFNDVVEYFFQILSELIGLMFSFVDLINKIAKSKGYKFSSVNISFEPPSFEVATTLGFPLSVPKVSFPKIDVSFEIEEPMQQLSKREWHSSTKDEYTISAVQASGFQDPHRPENVIDGLDNTRWVCEGIGSWILLDLGEVKAPVKSVGIRWYMGDRARYFFEIHSSLDRSESLGYHFISSGKTRSGEI